MTKTSSFFFYGLALRRVTIQRIWSLFPAEIPAEFPDSFYHARLSRPATRKERRK